MSIMSALVSGAAIAAVVSMPAALPATSPQPIVAAPGDTFEVRWPGTTSWSRTLDAPLFDTAHHAVWLKQSGTSWDVAPPPADSAFIVPGFGLQDSFEVRNITSQPLRLAVFETRPAGNAFPALQIGLQASETDTSSLLRDEAGCKVAGEVVLKPGEERLLSVEALFPVDSVQQREQVNATTMSQVTLAGVLAETSSPFTTCAGVDAPAPAPNGDSGPLPGDVTPQGLPPVPGDHATTLFGYGPLAYTGAQITAALAVAAGSIGAGIFFVMGKRRRRGDEAAA